MLQGSPPSLSTAITGDPFAPRNEYALAIDFKYDPPFFKVSDSHYAKTWLLDERAKKINVPKKIVDLQNLIKKGIH
jgi:oligopeptide transport system ATP-binding protein